MATCLLTWATKAGPLSDPITCGILNQGMISFKTFLATTMAVSFLVGMASVHLEKVSTKTRRYLFPYLVGLTSMKLTFQSVFFFSLFLVTVVLSRELTCWQGVQYLNIFSIKSNVTSLFEH